MESQNPATNGKRLALTPGALGQPLGDVPAAARHPVGGGVRYTDAVFISTANTIADPPLHRRRRCWSRRRSAQHLTLRLNVYNVTDRVYIRSINNNAGRYNPGTPRSFLLGVGAIRF